MQVKINVWLQGGVEAAILRRREGLIPCTGGRAMIESVRLADVDNNNIIPRFTVDYTIRIDLLR